jgi:hypothetical protein
MSDLIINEVVERLKKMPDTLQIEVLDFTRNLKESVITGVSGKNLLQFVGTIPEEDLVSIRQAIESDCEQVDLDEW